MRKFVRSFLLPSLVVLMGGFLLVAVSWMIYYGIYMFVETAYFPTDPQSVPADQIRTGSAIVLFITYLLLSRFKMPDLVKATLFVAPLTMMLITIVLDLYMRPLYATLAFVALVGASIFVIVRLRRPWHYFLATAMSILVALVYAWPR